MKKIVSGLINAVFFIGGDVAYSLFAFGHEDNPIVFFGVVIIVLLFFVIHKIDCLSSKESKDKKTTLRGKKYTNWILSAVLGASFAFFSNGSTLLRWIFG